MVSSIVYATWGPRGIIANPRCAAEPEIILKFVRNTSQIEIKFHEKLPNLIRLLQLYFLHWLNPMKDDFYSTRLVTMKHFRNTLDCTFVCNRKLFGQNFRSICHLVEKIDSGWKPYCTNVFH